MNRYWPIFSLLMVFALNLPAQDLSTYPILPHRQFVDGEDTLRAFGPISSQTRNSVVEVDVKNDAVAFGTVVESDGLVLTKASQIKPGKLTCWLASGREVSARIAAVDEADDVALLQLSAKGLRPVRWAGESATVGQWAVTPCLGETPQAAGIVSALSRRIRPERAYIGIEFDMDNTAAQIHSVEKGMGADQAGLRPGDLIAAINGTRVTSRDQVIDLIGEFREGDKVKLEIRRGETEFETNVLLTSPHTGKFAWEWMMEREENRMAGDVSARALGFDDVIEHDTVLEPWMCGGPLVDLDGRALGINIARASRVASYALPAPLVQEILKDLKNSAAHQRTQAGSH